MLMLNMKGRLETMKKFLKTVLVITLCASFFAGCTSQENIDSKPHWVYRDINVEVTSVRIEDTGNLFLKDIYITVKSDEYGTRATFVDEAVRTSSHGNLPNEYQDIKKGDILRAEVALYIVDSTNEVQDMEIERLY